ncbi:MAG: zinc ABC transporter substrate-binding protein [Candidatus Omnitrophica bacterium]|nr:zinc ABC transporter substrate-binding protein [Candidatus Omnitrophota bacterium]
MTVNTIRKAASSLIILALLQFCSAPTLIAKEATRVKVVVTIEPLAVFVRGVAADTADIIVLVPPGADPHTYEPRPGQLRELSRADVLVETGAGLDFETAFVEKVAAVNRKLVVCDSSRGIELIEPDDEAHSEGDMDHDHHAHAGKDPHIWLDPVNAIRITDNIKKALTEANPDNSDFYEVNTGYFQAELLELDRELRDMLGPVRGRTFLVVHSAWKYFARAYGLEEIAIQHGGKDPTVKGLVDMIKKAEMTGAKMVFISPQFDPRSAEVISAETGAKLVVADPLAEDYFGNLRDMAKKMAEN